MMEVELTLARVCNGAHKGARSVTRRPQVIVDAVDQTIARWEEAVLRQKAVANWEAWAFRVGANAAKRLGSRPAQPGGAEVAARLAEPPPDTEPAGLALPPELLRREVVAKAHLLVGRQAEVLLKFCEPGMTVHRASRELKMDRKSLRRSFLTGLSRIRGP